MNIHFIRSHGRKGIAVFSIVLIGLILAAAIVLSDRAVPQGDEHDHAHASTLADDQHANAASGSHDHNDAHTESILLADEDIAAAGIQIELAGPATIQSIIELPGEIRFNDDRTAHVLPRVSGVVQSVPVSLGQTVKKGQLLAVIASAAVSEQRSELQAAQKRLLLARSTYQREQKLWQEKISAEQDYRQAEHALREAEIAVANIGQKLSALGVPANAASLNHFELRAPFDGSIVEKHISVGESVNETMQLFTISDLRTVWAAISVAANRLDQVRVGEKAFIRSTALDQRVAGTVSYVGALLGEQTRAATAHVVLNNPKLAWRPGLFVTVELIVADEEVPVAVSTEAIQSLENQTVVFAKIPGGFVPRAVRTGRSDATRIEILQGLQAGDRYAAAGSFILKSDLGKAAAEHSH